MRCFSLFLVLVATPQARVLAAISNPDTALILFVIGAICIYVEFTLPGSIAPGVCGAVLMVLSLTAFSLFPIQWLGVALILLAITFFILEAKFTSHGVLTAAGAACMIFGALNLIDPASNARIHPVTAISTAIPFALISGFLFSLAAKARRNKVVTGPEAMLRQIGIATVDMNPSGVVAIRGEYWNARSTRPVPRDAKVRVTGIEGLTLRVEPAKEPDITP